MIDNFTFTCLGTGLEENNSDSQVSIYPNPTSNLFHIKTKSKESFRYYLMDPAGKKIMTTDKNTIDVSMLDVGLYFLRIENDRNSYVKKFILQ